MNMFNRGSKKKGMLQLCRRKEQMTNQTVAQSASISVQNPVSQQQQQRETKDTVTAASKANTKRLTPNLPRRDLLRGLRKAYLKIGVPLYEASIKCDWKAAKAVIDKYPEIELVRYSITENGETALHVAASAKVPKKVEGFVENLVKLMTKEDLELENESYNTALYLAAAAGNVKAVKIMVEKNRALLTIPGAGGTMMPLYVAVLFGHYEVSKYLFDNSNRLSDDGWTDRNRGWLLEKCVENDMFDVALEIVKKYPKLGTSGSVLGILARKPEAFPDTVPSITGRTINSIKRLCSLMSITHQPSQSERPEIGTETVSAEHLYEKAETSPKPKCNIIGRTIKLVFAFVGSKVGACEKKSKALPLLNIIWNEIAQKPKRAIDDILRGPPDMKQYDKPDSESLDQAFQLQKLISERIVNMHVDIQNIIKQDTNPATSGKEDQALRLEKLISEHIAKMHVETQNAVKVPAETTSKHPNVPSTGRGIRTYPDRILFVAAEMGNTKFLVELIRQYPDLIWKVNDDNLSIFHIAVKHRHEGIYNLLYEIGSMKDLITPLKDPNGNTMLHLVGKCAKQKRLDDVSGVALQMQRELLWFQEVEAMIPPSYRERKNKDGLTAYELFTMEHKDLVTLGESWMKETANQCMVVAALIATIVFAAAFTLPGGYDQNNGLPFFRSKAILMVFVVSDAISFLSLSASILMFLSILTSRYAERDFLESLPKKLMGGLATLFLSITTMTITFGVSFFIFYDKGLLWTPILIGVLAVMPVLLYIKLQIGLFVDVIRSTYGSRYLFKPQKHVLYHENPKV